jgi:hypothetical protein
MSVPDIFERRLDSHEYSFDSHEYSLDCHGYNLWLRSEQNNDHERGLVL